MKVSVDSRCSRVTALYIGASNFKYDQSTICINNTNNSLYCHFLFADRYTLILLKLDEYIAHSSSSLSMLKNLAIIA